MIELVAVYRQMVAALLVQLELELTNCGASTQGEWAQLVHTIRTDVDRMGTLSASECAAEMPAHRRRFMRLRELHGQMFRLRQSWIESCPAPVTASGVRALNLPHRH